MFTGLLRWLRGLVSTVPEEMAVCEFECHKAECRFGDWSNCKFRREGMVRTVNDDEET